MTSSRRAVHAPRRAVHAPRRAVHVSVTAATCAALVLGTGPALGVASTGPSTTVAPYVLPVAPDVDITSLLTVGDQPTTDGFRMVGIPDGLGAVETGKDLVVYLNHELRSNVGAVRAHGQQGAFVSRLVIDPETGEVKKGSDLIQDVAYYNYLTGSASEVAVAPAGATAGTHTDAFSRFCSGALTDPGQLFNATMRTGYKGRVYFANEESGDEGRVFGVTKDGIAHQLPRLGLFSWENTLAAANTTNTTTVMGNEDTGTPATAPNVNGGQLWVYAGQKTRSGTAIDKAGLTNGTLKVLDAKDESITSQDQILKNQTIEVTLGTDELIDWTRNGTSQNTEAAAKGINFQRIEDGAFDPRDKNAYYFITTEGGDKTPRPEGGALRDGGGLWKMVFQDVEKPERGGTLTHLLDGTEAPYLNKPDNMMVDAEGNLLIQEDPGGNEHLARIVAYRPSDDRLAVVAQFDAALFLTGAPGFLTNDEESSGIIQLEDGSYLFDAQVHKPSGDPTTVELGQLLHMTIDDWDAIYGDGDDKITG